MKNIELIVWFFFGTLSYGDANGYSPDQGFYVITNQPSRGRNSGDLYLYAIDTDTVNSEDEIKFEKSESGLSRSIVKTGEIRTHPADLWGCYLKVGQPNRYKGSRYGTYTVTLNGGTSINTFVRPQTKFLNTKGVYTVTVYPEEEGSTELAPSDDNPIGVAWTPGCQNIRWCKGKRRNINTGPRLTLTSTKDAGIYTIQRRNRGKRGWFVQIEVIVASCPEGQYYDGVDDCEYREEYYPCQNGGVEKDAEDACICPPFLADEVCSAHRHAITADISHHWTTTQGDFVRLLGVNLPSDPFALGYGDETDLFCGDLYGGSTKCKGYLYCPGGLFGCKCFPGWFGNNCDKPCPKGKWGIECSQTCPDDNKQCNRFYGPDTSE